MSLKDYLKEENGAELLGIKSFRDGLSLEDIQENPDWHWVIMAGISNVVLGKKGKKLIWYSGTWTLGTWDSKFAIWKSGKWFGGMSADGGVHIKGDSPNKW